MAGRSGGPGTEGADRHILANPEQPGRDLGLALGPTPWAAYRRRQKSRRLVETQTGKTMRRVRRS